MYTVVVEKTNKPQKGRISVQKSGDAFASVAAASSSYTDENGEIIVNPTTYTPVFEETGLAGAVFEITAAEDIVTADGTIRAKKGDVVATLTTDENGYAAETNSGTLTTEPIPFISSQTLPAEVMQELTSQAEELNNAYPDAIGWLYIPSTNINYPIMQSADNDFYLHHAPDGRSLKAGSVFLDFRCENRFMNGVNIVYAHNMNNGTMFAGVTKFKDAGYFDSHRYGWLATSETVYRIDFFSAAVVDRYDSLYDGSVLSADWLPHLAEVSTIYEASEFSDTDRFISLSTCSYEFENARTVLTGKLTKMEVDRNVE